MRNEKDVASSTGGARRRAARGFTFIEVVIAVALLIIGFLGLFASLHTSANLSESAKETNIAMFKLETAVEYLFGLAYDDVAANMPEGAPIDIVALSDSNNSNNFRLNGEQVFIAYEDVTPDFMKFTITINWNTRMGTPRTASLSSGRMR